ncbi:MAG: hypothetical protein R3B06_07635 [Kofleriaceae bacterium]
MGVTQPPRPTSDALAQLATLAHQGGAPVAPVLLPAHAELVEALIAAHGDLETARAAAGLVEPADRYRDREQVIAALHALAAAGESLSPRRLRELGEASLLAAAHALFGGLSLARRAAGLPAVLRTLPWFAPRNRPRRRWTAEHVVDALTDRLAARLPVTARALTEAGEVDLLAAIAAHVGSVDEAVRRARSMLRFRESTAAEAPPPRRVGRPPGRRPAAPPVPAPVPSDVRLAAEAHAASVRQQMIEADLARKAERDSRTVAALDTIAGKLQVSRAARAARIAAAKAAAAAERAARKAERERATGKATPAASGGAAAAPPAVASPSLTPPFPSPVNAPPIEDTTAADRAWAAAERVRADRQAKRYAALDAARAQLEAKRAALAAAREARAREIAELRAQAPVRRRGPRPPSARASGGPRRTPLMLERWAQFEREVTAAGATAHLPVGLLTIPLEAIAADRTDLVRQLGAPLMAHLERQAELLELAPPGPARQDLVRIVEAIGADVPVPAGLQALVQAWSVAAPRLRQRKRSLEGLTPFRPTEDR